MKLCDVCSSQLMRVVLEPKVALTNRHTHTHTHVQIHKRRHSTCVMSSNSRVWKWPIRNGPEQIRYRHVVWELSTL